VVDSGDVLDNRYRLIRILGEGGMGIVWVAEHMLLDKLVAVKLLHSRFAEDERPVERFYREAKSAASVGHDGIVEIYDMGQTADGTPYFVMELLDGQSLHAVLMRKGCIEVPLAVRITREVLKALAAVHAKGIIHRDLKPENIFVCRRSDGSMTMKILDFGFSKMTHPTLASKITRSGEILGTAHYMSPEQACGRDDVDHRADIWSMGVLLYEMLTGELPYTGKIYTAIIAKILTKPFAPPREHVPELPEELEAVILKAMTADPDKRYQTAGELIDALRPFQVKPSRSSLISTPPSVLFGDEREDDDSPTRADMMDVSLVPTQAAESTEPDIRVANESNLLEETIRQPKMMLIAAAAEAAACDLDDEEMIDRAVAQAVAAAEAEENDDDPTVVDTALGSAFKGRVAPGGSDETDPPNS